MKLWRKSPQCVYLKTGYLNETKWDQKDEAVSARTGAMRREETAGFCAHRKRPRELTEDRSAYRSARDSSQGSKNGAPWPWTCSLQSYEEIHFCQIDAQPMVSCYGPSTQMEQEKNNVELVDCQICREN
jgi:hypothetical protein